jgi:hypothetical protein
MAAAAALGVAAGELMEDEELDQELLGASAEDLLTRARLLDTEVKVLKSEAQRLQLEKSHTNEKIKENAEKIKLNKQLPYLVGNVVEILDIVEEDEEDGGNFDLDSQRKGKAVVLKTSTRQTIFLPVIGLVAADELKPGDLVGVNKDSYLILEALPTEFDSRVKAMEVDERPTETYSDVGGLDKQIQELVEAVVLPMTHADRFEKLGIKPPKGVLMYGPPGVGKTLLARACAAQTNATYLKLAGPQLVQMFIGDGAKLVRDAFALAKEKVCRAHFTASHRRLLGRRRPSLRALTGVPRQLCLRSRRVRRSFSSTSWMRSAPSVSTRSSAATARSSARCSSCSTSSTGFPRTIASRSLRRRTESTFWTPRCCARGASIGRSSSRTRTSPRGAGSCRFTPAK